MVKYIFLWELLWLFTLDSVSSLKLMNIASPNLNRLINHVLPVSLGIFAFFLVVGGEVLNPQYTGWLMGRFDPIQHYLGWDFFRRSEWANPIGLSPTFGLDISSSIVYADSIPLMAIIFKVFDQILPLNFSTLGFGCWSVLCCKPILDGNWQLFISSQTLNVL